MIRSMNRQTRRLVPAFFLAALVASCAVAPALAVQETQTDRGSDPRDGNRQSEQDHGGLSRFGQALRNALWNGWALFSGQCCGTGPGSRHNAEQRAREGNGSSNF